MRPQDVFVGPLLRRAEPSLVVVALATTTELRLRFSVRESGATAWAAHDEEPFVVKVSDHLWFHHARIRPDRPLPTGRVLEYGVAVGGATGWDAEPFTALVATDHLAYPGFTLPTFVLQPPGTELNALYGSCRKVHDEHGGKTDALAAGDALVAKVAAQPSRRPTLLCLGGDQIYADDVHPRVLDAVLAVAARIQSPPEQLPGPARTLGGGGRKAMLQRYAKLTSDDLDRHLVRFTEYLAMYGLMWNERTWPSRPAELEHFLVGLPAVRRLLANIPTYMIFDDHDVTDDWNLSVRWREEVAATDLGRRLVRNALMAYWLCQDYGNDPDRYGRGQDRALGDLVTARDDEPGRAESAFWGLDRWEFATPTDPFVYFVDTRTARGYEDEPDRRDRSAPAFLRTYEAWAATVDRLRPLLAQQGDTRPLVLVTAAPVFGFAAVESVQRFVSLFVGDYKFDLESWGANRRHLQHFIDLVRGRDVVLLSGDVHYGFTSTVGYTVFDSDVLRAGGPRRGATGTLPRTVVGGAATYRPIARTKFLQLNSSALKNYASRFTWFLSKLSSTGLGTITTDAGVDRYGRYENGVFVLLEQVDDGGFEQVLRTAAEVRPVTLFHQHVNDADNTDYLEDHNLGVVSIRGSTVRHAYETPKGRRSERTWDFRTERPWL